MNSTNLSRRNFLAASAGTLAAVTSGAIPAYAGRARKAGRLAINGGTPGLLGYSPGEVDRLAADQVVGITT